MLRRNKAIDSLSDAIIFIRIDLDTGYWQIDADPQTKHKLLFYTDKEKMMECHAHRHTEYPCYIWHNDESTSRKWTQATHKYGIIDVVSKVFVDDVILASTHEQTLLDFAKILFETLIKYQATIKLKMPVYSTKSRICWI